MPSGCNPMGGYRFFRNVHAQNKKPGRDRFDPKLWRLGYAEDFTWRVKELSDLKQVIRLSGNPYAAVARKAALALVYAHWEGYVVFVAAAYIATCQLPRGLPRSPVRPSARRPGCVLPPRRNAVSFPHCQEPPSPCPRYCNRAMRSPRGPARSCLHPTSQGAGPCFDGQPCKAEMSSFTHHRMPQRISAASVWPVSVGCRSRDRLLPQWWQGRACGRSSRCWDQT